MSDITWIDNDNYWTNDSVQLSNTWFSVRRARVTGSTISSFINHSRFSTPEETAIRILGLGSVEVNDLMSRGIKLEPNARRWLSKMLGMKITEIGLCVPKWDYRLGVSVDGVLDDGNICEIKIPKSMYKPLIIHKDEVRRGVKFSRYYHRHIWDSHYDQMQLGMSILGAKYCYYTVYLPSDNVDIPEDYYIEKIPFNESYWSEIYKELSERYNNLLLPLMKERYIERIDPDNC